MYLDFSWVYGLIFGISYSGTIFEEDENGKIIESKGIVLSLGPIQLLFIH